MKMISRKMSMKKIKRIIDGPQKGENISGVDD